MAKIHRIQKTYIDADTRKRVPILDDKGKQIYLPNWRARIEDHNGNRRFYTLSTDRKQAQKEADMIENREREIRQGLRPIPTHKDKASDRNTFEAMEEYLAWGNLQGGRKGRPWSPTHARDKRSALAWWLGGLKFKRIGEAKGCLSAVEKLLQEVAQAGRPDKRPGRNKPRKLSGKSLQTLACALKSFFEWCTATGRDYLDANPLENLGKFNTEPLVVRRNMSGEEIGRLLDAAPLYHRLLLEVGLCTGLRRGEMRALTPNHFDPEAKTLFIDAGVDKARVERHQRIPESLVVRLSEFIESGEAMKLYKRHYARRHHTSWIPEQPLLFVPMHASRTLARIAKKAGVELVTHKGKIDFHALRVAYINMLITSGADFKTILELSRHTAAYMTALYARAEDGLIDKAVESIGRRVIPTEHPDDDVSFGFALRMVQ